MLTVGDKFPAFHLKAAVSLEKGKEFKDVTEKDHAGKWKVVFFWPMDFTFICPTEIAEFGKQNGQFLEVASEIHRSEGGDCHARHRITPVTEAPVFFAARTGEWKPICR